MVLLFGDEGQKEVVLLIVVGCTPRFEVDSATYLAYLSTYLVPN